MPRTQSESVKSHDEKILSVSKDGTKNILDAMNDNCKIIFPSTHVVYEGIDEVSKDIKEEEKTKPVLSYSKSKAINEKQIKESKKNYVILRLGSVYGYSTDTMRTDIMPNLFSKLSSQNGTIKLFAKSFIVPFCEDSLEKRFGIISVRIVSVE